MHCDQARRRCRTSERLNGLLCEALLATRAFARAEIILREQPTPDPVRLARLRMGQRRFVDAAEIITRALEQPERDARQRAVLCELLLRLFDQFEDRQRIIEAVKRLPRSEPELVLRGAVSLLRCSAWSEAIRIASRLRDQRALGGKALTVMLVAAYGADRTRLAHLAARRLQTRTVQVDPSWTAEAWLAGHLGQVMADQIAVPHAGDRDASNLLDDLIADARRTLSTGEPAPDGRATPDSRRRELLELCRLALTPQAARPSAADRIARAA
jgi:hypothetical protein